MITDLNTNNIRKQKIKIIDQCVDTLKMDLYKHQDLTTKQINDYNIFVSDLKELKHQAMQIISFDNQSRHVPTTINDINFDVMASVQGAGYSVQIRNADVTISFKNITDISNNPIISIEFRSEFLHRQGYVKCINDVRKIIDSFLPIYKIKITELHLATDTQGYTFTDTDRYRLRFRNRSLEAFEESEQSYYQTGLNATGFSIGKGEFMLRIYNKTFQINKIKKAGYVKVLKWDISPNYDEDIDVWRVEFQVRRSYLKTLSFDKYGILDGFENVLNAIPEIWSHCISRIVHYDISEKGAIELFTKKKINKDWSYTPLSTFAIRKRFQRANYSPLWQVIAKFNNYEASQLVKYNPIKLPEKEYVVNSVKSVFTTLTKVLKGNFNPNALTDIILEANQKSLEKTDLGLLEHAKLKTLDFVNDCKANFTKYGEVTDGFTQFNQELKENLKKTFSVLNPHQQDVFFDECIKRGTMIYNRYDNQPVNQTIENYEFYSY
jgi:hypothetical protein